MIKGEVGLYERGSEEYKRIHRNKDGTDSPNRISATAVRNTPSVVALMAPNSKGVSARFKVEP